MQLVSQKNKDAVEMDAFDKQILYHLSKGIKSKDIPQFVPLSSNAIEKRKASIKDSLSIIEGSDVDLVRVAKEKGLI